jgi:TATA-box binding protein (TBP) (component of TFIID and TFIIIB)
MDLTSTDLDALLNFDHVAVTPLGQLTAWVGDLFYPFLIYGLVLGAVVVLFFVGSQVKIWHKSRGRGFPCYD